MYKKTLGVSLVKKKNSAYLNDNIIDLSDIIKTFWKEKIFIFSISLMFTVIGYIYSSFQPKIYQTEINYKDANELNLFPGILEIIEFKATSDFSSQQEIKSIQNNLIKYFNENVQFYLLSKKSINQFLENYMYQFLENNNEINIFKTQPKKINYKSYSKNLVMLEKKKQKYILTFLSPIQGEKLLEDYIIFIIKKVDKEIKKYLEEIILTKIYHKENILKTLEKIDLDNLDANSKYENKIKISLLSNDILSLKNYIDNIKTHQFVFNIDNASTQILISKPLSVYLVSSFLFGFLFSSLIIFFKKYII